MKHPYPKPLEYIIMNILKPLCLIGCGVVAGIALVLSCGGDNGPRLADAADAPMCNCPAAEPPISSRIMEVKSDTATIPKGLSHESRGIACPSTPKQTVLIGGGCTIDYPSQLLGNVVLEESAPSENGWHCTWSNPTNLDVPVHVVVRCLVPAP